MPLVGIEISAPSSTITESILYKFSSMRVIIAVLRPKIKLGYGARVKNVDRRAEVNIEELLRLGSDPRADPRPITHSIYATIRPVTPSRSSRGCRSPSYHHRAFRPRQCNRLAIGQRELLTTMRNEQLQQLHPNPRLAWTILSPTRQRLPSYRTWEHSKLIVKP